MENPERLEDNKAKILQIVDLLVQANSNVKLRTKDENKTVLQVAKN